MPAHRSRTEKQSRAPFGGFLLQTSLSSHRWSE